MNLELLDTFGQHYPEESSGVLECGIIICCRFNRWGSLLACGCNDGRVAVFDFITRQLAKVIQTHAQPIAAIS
jgi:COMPASS component SWD1